MDDGSTIEVLASENVGQPLKLYFNIVFKLRYKYFRFLGRHLEFLDFHYIVFNGIQVLSPTPLLPHTCLKV